MAEDESTKAQLERIQTITQTARATWFGYLTIVAFGFVTLAQVRDIDFFSADATTALPVLGIDVPTTSFFLGISVLAATAFIYLHVFIEQLWHQLGRIKPRIGGAPVSAHIHPWLVSEFALHIRRLLRPGERPCVTASPLGLLGTVASGGLLYLAGPTLLAWLWLRSQPAHRLWLTGVIAILTVLAIWSAVASAAAPVRKMRQGGGGVPFHPAVHVMVTLVLGAVGWIVSDLRTVTDMGERAYAQWLRPVPAQMAEANITELPSDWLSYRRAREEFFFIWCKRPDTPECGGEIPVGRDTSFMQEFSERRDTYLRVLGKPILVNRNLTRAEMLQAHLPGIDLRGARMEGASLAVAQMEGADLSRAQMAGVFLIAARLERANLEEARLERALLAQAQLDGANLFKAQLPRADMRAIQMEGAFLQHANLEGAFLDWAQMVQADLSRARLAGASLRRARMDEATLTEARLDQADLREARMDGVVADRASLVRANLGGASLANADLQEARLAGASLAFAGLEGADLDRARLEGADLSGARLAGAFLGHSRLTGTARRPMGWRAADLSAGIAPGAVLRHADLRRATADFRTDFRNSFGDGTVRLPATIARPCQWGGEDEVFSDAEFWGRWRGWLAEYRYAASWLSVAPDGFETVEPIPPPEGCTWHTGPLPHGP